jgi:DNA polymerase III subunit alpha
MSDLVLTAAPVASFVHLRLHTEFSVQDGLLRVDAAVKLAAHHGQPALALTDLNNVFGYIKFYKAARKAGVKAICGVDVWISNPRQRDHATRLLLLVCNHDGYLQLNTLLTRAFLENAWKGRPEINADWLTPQSTSGLFALSGAVQGEIGHAVVNGQDFSALDALAQRWADQFPNRFFIELQRDGGNENAVVNDYTQHAIALAGRTGLPVVATHAIQFAALEDYDAHEARVCIAAGEMLADTRRVRRFSPDQYFKSSLEMAALFADVPVALSNSMAIATACNLHLTLGKARLPDFATPGNIPIEQHLENESQRGLDARMLRLYKDLEARESQRPRYQERQAYELGVINKMGFPGYFLIVADFIAWAKANGVPVGAGRGSGAGSLVAYALGITDIDPMEYDLLFERFLNPERVSMPDFDIDFCQDKRGEVIKYVKQKYGAAAVSQIATFGTLGAKAVVRDVGRVMDMSYNYCDGLSKLIPANPTDPWDLNRTLKEEPQFKQRYENEGDAKAIVDMSLSLEGLTRNVGMHAGGVLIAPGKLTDFCPLYCQPGKPDDTVSQYDKDDVEAIGLVKFDFLGLKNLTTIDYAVRDIQRMTAGHKEPSHATLALEDIPLDDPAVLNMFSSGNTVAVFQCEGSGARKLCMDMGADSFDDVIALMALNRPGPLNSGMVDDYIARKKEQARTGEGRDAWYVLPQLAEVLRPTYGVMVYQEQVMQVAQVVGGYTLGGADVLRRIMGKKKKEDLEAEMPKFLDGAAKQNIDAATAQRLFDLMAKFADYGFNKSHSAAYGLISYHTAWLKYYYPAAYMAAAMTLDAGNTDQLQVLVDDARAQGLTVLPPCVNDSVHRFRPVDAKQIRYGLGGLKGAGENAAVAIAAEREANGSFVDLLDFCTRVDKRAVNRRAVEALIRSGGFDSLNHSRAKLLASVDAAMSAAEAASESAGQNALFGLDEAPAMSLPHLDGIAEWSLVERLREEKAAIGYHFSGHLFDAYSTTARALGTTPLNELKPSGGKKSSKADPWVAGIVRAVRIQIGKKGKMAYVTLDDRTALTEIAVFSDSFNAAQSLLTADTFLAIKVRVFPTDTGGMRLSAAEVANEDGLWAKRCGHVNLTLMPNAGREVFNLIKSHLGTEGASLSLQLQQAGSSGEVQFQNVYLKATATCIAELRNHPAIEKLSFAIGDAKSAQLQEDYDIPEEPEHFASEDAFSSAYSESDVPAYDAEYDYA